MVLNIPANIESLEVWTLSTPVDDLLPPPLSTQPLIIRSSTSTPTPPEPIPLAPDSDSDRWDTASTLSRRSSCASSATASSYKSASTLVDSPDTASMASTTKSSFSHTLSLPPLPHVSYSPKLGTVPMHQASSPFSSPRSSPRLTDRSLTPTPIPKSRSSSRNRQGESPQRVIIPTFERSPKVKPKPAPTVDELNDKRLSFIRDNVNCWAPDISLSPCDVEPPMSARLSDFGDDDASITPTNTFVGPSVQLKLAQLSLHPPEVVSKAELPSKRTRFTTRR